MEANLNVHFSAEQIAAINALVDSKVEDRMKKFQEDYDELMNKVKRQIATAIKPASLLGKTSIVPPKTDVKAGEESKDTSASHTPSQSTSRPSIGGAKRPGTTSVMPKPTPSRRSDSKESQKNGAAERSTTVPAGDKQAAEERKRELLEKKRQEEERKKEEARLKKEEQDRKRKEEADKKKQADEERKKKLQDDKVAAEKKKLEQQQAQVKNVGGKAAAGGAGAGGLLQEDEDDPIAKSLNERIRAGGVT